MNLLKQLLKQLWKAIIRDPLWYQRWTDRSRAAMKVANALAKRAGQRYIKPKDLLAALLDSPQGVGVHMLKMAGVDLT